MSEDQAAPEGTFSSIDEALSPSETIQSHMDGGLESGKQPDVPLSTSGPRSSERGSGLTSPKAKRSSSPKRKVTTSTGFAPADFNDGRERWDWQTKYPPDALKIIKREWIYLLILLYTTPFLMLLIWSKWIWGNLGLGQERYSLLARFSYAWLGGMLGGILFDVKWLYHSVAKGLWHRDRSLWRIFTPHISGALAFSLVLLISSNLLKAFDQAAFGSSVSVVAVSFLVGYFSDSAVAKLTELSETLFGTTRKGRERMQEEAKGDKALSSQPPKVQGPASKVGAGKG